MTKHALLTIWLMSCTAMPRTTPQSFQIAIDMIDYGMFEVGDMSRFDAEGLPKEYSTIRLSRHFVTEPSLYLWAWEHKRKKNLPQAIHLTSPSAVILLARALPLSWTIEKSPEGGYFEQVDITALRKLGFRPP